MTLPFNRFFLRPLVVVSSLVLLAGTAYAKGDLVVGLSGIATRLDAQQLVTGSADAIASSLIYDTLVLRDAKGEFHPGIAESWEVSKDGKTIRFTIRDGATYHDGTPITAASVKALFDSTLSPDNKSFGSGAYKPYIDSVTLDGDRAVVFNLKYPYAAALALLAIPSGGIQSPGSLGEQKLNESKAVVGSGPYRLVDWVPGDSITLEANPDYWGGKPAYDTITLRQIPENESRVLALETGEVGVINNLPSTSIPSLKDTPGVTVHTFPSTRIQYLGFNNETPLLSNVKVRQALNYAIDRDAIVNTILTGIASPATGVVSSNAWGYSNVGQYPYDPEKARSLLKEAGVSEGAKLELAVPETYLPGGRQIGELLQANFKAVGIDATIKRYEWSTFQGVMEAHKGYEAYLLGWASVTGDADRGLTPFSAFGVTANFANYNNPQVFEGIGKAAQEVDPDARKATYRKVLEQLKEDAPWAPLAEINYAIGTADNVGGAFVDHNGILILRYAAPYGQAAQ
ncbi:MAG: ABC transporter substrate-binding protein [Rhizobium sp.]